MNITERWDYERKEILEELEKAPSILTFYRTDQQESRFLYSDFGEEEFRLLTGQIHRHVALYDFVKGAVIAVDRSRAEGNDSAMLEAINYIKLKQSKTNNLNQ